MTRSRLRDDKGRFLPENTCIHCRTPQLVWLWDAWRDMDDRAYCPENDTDGHIPNADGWAYGF